MNHAPKGKLFIITGPSGVGKGTLCQRLLADVPELKLSISATSRPKRAHETDGHDYYFKSRQQFEHMIADGELLEWAEYNGNYYGTPRGPVSERLESGLHVLLEIEVQGALQVKEQFPDDSCLIFIDPPSLHELERRLRGRGTDSDEDIQNRLQIALKELALKEQFDFVVVNEDLDICLRRIRLILDGFSPERMLQS